MFANTFKLRRISQNEIWRRHLKIKGILGFCEDKFWIPATRDEELSNFNLIGELPSRSWAKVHIGQLVPLRTITTYHCHKFFGFPGASIRDVLAQIPKKHLKETTAFEITNWCKKGILVRQPEYTFNTTIHRAQVTLYTTV